MSVKSTLNLLIGIMFILLVVAIWNNHVLTTTVLIQEGHVGRTSGNIGSTHRGIKESEWNHLVGVELERILIKKGISVVRVGADIPVSNAVIAIAIHFDGSNQACSTGASIGHNNTSSAQAMAKRWRKSYSSFFPFKWHRDNFTKNLSQYYGFSRVHTSKGFLVLELGEITCDKQMDWLKPKLKQVASKIAHFIIKELKE